MRSVLLAVTMIFAAGLSPLQSTPAWAECASPAMELLKQKLTARKTRLRARGASAQSWLKANAAAERTASARLVRAESRALATNAAVRESKGALLVTVPSMPAIKKARQGSTEVRPREVWNDMMKFTEAHRAVSRWRKESSPAKAKFAKAASAKAHSLLYQHEMKQIRAVENWIDSACVAVVTAQPAQRRAPASASVPPVSSQQ